MTGLGVNVDFALYPWFVPGTAISIVVALLLAQRMAQRLGSTRATAFILLASLGAIVAVTLTPGRGLSAHPVGCDMGRLGPAAFDEYLAGNDTTFNVLLFVPLGFALAVLPGSTLKLGLLAAAILLPFAIETVQLIAMPLGRACQSADVVDNLSGLALGAATGIASAALWRRF